MRLNVDLGFDAEPDRTLSQDGSRALDLHLIASALRSPRRLRALLRNQRYAEVHVRTGELPLSALQAGALVALAIVRAPRFIVDGRSHGRAAFAASALAKAPMALVAELAHSARLALLVERSARRRCSLPRSCATPRRALYIRVDPTLRWFGSQVGGAATHTSGVINGLMANQVDVTVLAAERPVGTAPAAYVKVPPQRILHLAPGLTYTEYTGALLAASQGHQGDFVYQRYQLGSYAGLELARRLGVPLVLEFNGSEIWVERNWRSGEMRLSRPLERLEARNLLEASLIVVVSAPLRDYVIAQGASPQRVLLNPNGVDTEALAPLREHPPAVWRDRLGLVQRPTVGFVGTFGLWHGVTLLPALIEQIPEANFTLIGDGDLLPQVRGEVAERGLSNRVQLTGVLDHQTALQLLAACDVCISPHIRNPDGTPFFGSPTKVFEYMGLAKPIVASDLDQIGEVIDDERNGLLVAPGDVGMAAAAVRRLLDDARLCERLGWAALRDAEARYNWTSHVGRILSALSG